MSTKRLNALLQKTALIAFIIGFVSVFLLQNAQTTKAQDEALLATSAKPNIILILADDLDRDSIQFMPKLQALLKEKGVSFENYFVSLSLCCPSRVTTLRGQHAHT